MRSRHRARGAGVARGACCVALLGATFCATLASAQTVVPDTTSALVPHFSPLPVTGRRPAPAPSAADSLQSARPAPVAADPSLQGGHGFAEALAHDAPWMLSGTPAPGAWRAIASPGGSPRQVEVSLAGVRWRDPLEAGVDAATLEWWPWRLDANAGEVHASTSLLPTVPSRTLVGYETASDGARDVRAAVGGRIFGDADVLGWITASDADRRAAGGNRLVDRTQVLQISRPHGAHERIAVTVLNLPSLRERVVTADRADGVGGVDVSTLTQRRPRALDAAWSRRLSESDSLRTSFTWTSNHTDVAGVLAGTAWSESVRGGAMRGASHWTRGPLWAAGALQRETLSYRSITPTGKATGTTLTLADSSRSRVVAEVRAGTRRALGARGEWRVGVQLAAPGGSGVFLDPVANLRLGGTTGWSLHAAWDAGTSAATLLEPVRRVSEAIAAPTGAFPVERMHAAHLGVASVGQRGVIRIEGFTTTDAGFPLRDVAPYDAELAVRRSSVQVRLRGALGAADFRITPTLLMAMRGSVLASADSVLADAERPRALGAWVTTWSGRCLGVDCSLSSSLGLAAHTPSRFGANRVPATAAWDASLAVHLRSAWCVVRGENLAGRQLGAASTPFSTTPRVMASVLLRLID